MGSGELETASRRNTPPCVQKQRNVTAKAVSTREVFKDKTICSRDGDRNWIIQEGEKTVVGEMIWNKQRRVT